MVACNFEKKKNSYAALQKITDFGGRMLNDYLTSYLPKRVNRCANQRETVVILLQYLHTWKSFQPRLSYIVIPA